MERTKYTYFLGGQNPFFSESIDIIGEELEPVLESGDWEYSKDIMQEHHALRLKWRFTAAGGIVSAAVIGVSFFIVNWAAKKALDEFYTQKLRDALVKTYSRILKKLNLPQGKGVEYQHLITLEEERVTVLIRIFLKTESEIEDSFDTLLAVHNSAADWIKKNGRKAPIHCYTIENGSVNVEPVFYKSLEEIKVERMKMARKWIGGKKP